MQLEIRRLRSTDELAFGAATAAWDQAAAFRWTSPQSGQSFADWVALLARHEKGLDLPEGFVPYTNLFGFIGGTLVARASVRHELNEFLLNYAGHIGYAVIPAHRRRGYATQMLEASLREVGKLGVPRALVTCDEDNLGSALTIEGRGGVFEDARLFAGDGKPKRRYWIPTKN